MAVHLIKLCVGTDSVESLRQWQSRRLTDLRRAGKPLVLQHCTRSMPKRRQEILAGGSLYWVIKGKIRVRQRIVGLEAALDEEGRSCCAIRYDATLVATVPQAWRPFQGWRYLECADAPPDLGDGSGEARAVGDQDPPVEMLAELRSLGLL